MHTSTYSHTHFFLLFLNLSFYVSITSSFSLSLSIFFFSNISNRTNKRPRKNERHRLLLRLLSRIPRDVNRSYTDKLDLNLMR